MGCLEWAIGPIAMPADGRANASLAPLSFCLRVLGRVVVPCPFGAGWLRSLQSRSRGTVLGPERLRALRLRRWLAPPSPVPSIEPCQFTRFGRPRPVPAGRVKAARTGRLACRGSRLLRGLIALFAVSGRQLAVDQEIGVLG